MKFYDQGITLGTRTFGENQYLVVLLTKNHGKWSGMIRVKHGSELIMGLQLGSIVDLKWQSRLDEQLGRWSFEEIVGVNNIVWKERARSLLVEMACGLTNRILLEKDIHSDFFDRSKMLVEMAGHDKKSFLCYYCLWELALLRLSGFGLNTGLCAVTGKRQNLRYISPNSGRAVSEEAAGKYKPRLLKLPKFWNLDQINAKICQEIEFQDILESLQTTGFFLTKYQFLDKILGNIREQIINEIEDI